MMPDMTSYPSQTKIKVNNLGNTEQRVQKDRDRIGLAGFLPLHLKLLGTLVQIMLVDIRAPVIISSNFPKCFRHLQSE